MHDEKYRNEMDACPVYVFKCSCFHSSQDGQEKKRWEGKRSWYKVDFCTLCSGAHQSKKWIHQELMSDMVK